jgi:hypothetical protein
VEEDGKLSIRYWSQAVREKKGSVGHLLLLERRAALDPNTPQLEGVGEILLESTDRAGGYWLTRAEGPPRVNLRTGGVYLRAEPGDLATLDGTDNPQRVKLIADRLENWKSMKDS